MQSGWEENSISRISLWNWRCGAWDFCNQRRVQRLPGSDTGNPEGHERLEDLTGGASGQVLLEVVQDHVPRLAARRISVGSGPLWGVALTTGKDRERGVL